MMIRQKSTVGYHLVEGSGIAVDGGSGRVLGSGGQLALHLIVARRLDVVHVRHWAYLPSFSLKSSKLN